MRYPGRVIQRGEPDADVVRAIKRRLNAALGAAHDPAMRLDTGNPRFGPKMKQLVKLFQMRNLDVSGNPLLPDGKVGSLTWGALFGDETVPHRGAADSLLLELVLAVAADEEAKKVREIPRNSNRGPAVEAYLARTGLGPGFAWCCAFVYWCFDEAAKHAVLPNPMVKTAGCIDHWTRAPRRGAQRLAARAAEDDPGLVRPGMVFIMDHGGGAGHTGLVETVTGGMVTTVEGNTDASGTREGGGVYRLRRKLNSINKGFIDYAGA
jgi:hypothetical protein